jgi:hypothetical protein
MHNYIAHIICCASFTSIRLLAINELWIDGYNKPILINDINVPIHTYKQSRLLLTSAVSKQTNLPVVLKHLLLILVCLFFYFNIWMNLFHIIKKVVFAFFLLVCSVWNYVKRHFRWPSAIFNLKALSGLVALDIEFRISYIESWISNLKSRMILLCFRK